LVRAAGTGYDGLATDGGAAIGMYRPRVGAVK
jgi:hypothetical protein